MALRHYPVTNGLLLLLIQVSDFHKINIEKVIENLRPVPTSYEKTKFFGGLAQVCAKIVKLRKIF